MNENKVMNAKLRNKLSKIKQTRTTPKLFAFTKILAPSVLLLSVLVAKFNAVNSVAIAIVSDDRENPNHKNKAQNEWQFEWQKLIGNRKFWQFRHAQKRSLTA